MELTEKIRNNKRISADEALQLYDMDLFTLGQLANQKRLKLHGKKTYFNVNRHINPTNECDDVCKFCAFSSGRKNPNPYTMSIDEIVNTAKEAVKRGADELHIVSAHNASAGYDWYIDTFKQVRKALPKVHIKALTAAEIDFLARQYHKTYEDVIEDMLQCGVDSMPGGGAEIFDEKVREYICKGKVSSDNWLAIHKLWHQRGRKSNATMLFGHVESREDRIDHMLRLRRVQEETGGFNCFIPLVYQAQNNYLNVKNFLTGQEILKTMAISRIMLDNIAHLKAYWVTSTINLATVAQEFGADDLDGTIEKESINSAAGAQSAQG
ncbi:MAG: aminofutalosine synthase MqnE, partial [Campylobacterota bacterium]